MQRFDHTCRLLAVAFLALVMTGCQATMSTPSAAGTESHSEPPMFPLRFKTHSFAARCYSVRECAVIYDNHDFALNGNYPNPSSSPPAGDYRAQWALPTYSGIGNFPPPVDVHWTTLDGVKHEAKVDIGAIFKDERALYTVPDSEIPDRSWGGDPSIYLEINDRTINVYMRAFIATKTEQIPGNKDSDFRDDVILAWSHTY